MNDYYLSDSNQFPHGSFFSRISHNLYHEYLLSPQICYIFLHYIINLERNNCEQVSA